MNSPTQESGPAPERPVPRKDTANRLAKGLIIIAGIAWALSSIFEGLVLLRGKLLFTFGDGDFTVPLERLPLFAQAELREGTSGSLADADLLLRALSAVPLFLEALISLLAVWLLLKVLRLVAARDIFSTRTITQWKRLALTLTGGGVLVGAYNTFLFGFAALYPGISNVSEPTRTQEFLGADYSGIGIDAPYWPVTIIAAGLVAYALTAAFRAGAKLERDVDGLV